MKLSCVYTVKTYKDGSLDLGQEFEWKWDRLEVDVFPFHAVVLDFINMCFKDFPFACVWYKLPYSVAGYDSHGDKGFQLQSCIFYVSEYF